MKAIEVLHSSYTVYAVVTAVAVVIVTGLIVTSPRVTRHLPRLGKCAAFGAATAGALVWYAATRRHTQLAAQAARPANGQHLSAVYILADGFTFTFLVVTVVTFAVATMAARRRAPALRAPARPRAGTWTWPS